MPISCEPVLPLLSVAFGPASGPGQTNRPTENDYYQQDDD